MYADEFLLPWLRHLTDGLPGGRLVDFDLRHRGVAAVFAAAAERRLPVIIHAGLGIGSLGRDALTLGERYPEAPLILAHLGVTDLAWIWRRLRDHPNLFFDAAWWNPADHLALFAHVPPGRILLGSDAPYGTPAAAAIVAIRCALPPGSPPRRFRRSPTAKCSAS